MSDTPNYKIWKPEHDGHAPPNWREGMEWATGLDSDGMPMWRGNTTYAVPAKALNSPNDDASGDVDTWKRDEAPVNKRLALRGFIQIIKDFPPEMLAEEGITLAPERDWATELWADLIEAADMKIWVSDIRKGNLRDYDQAAIALIRERVVLKEVRND